MREENKYPIESDRRRFVKGVVGSAAIGGLGSTGVAAVETATPPTGTSGGLTEFMGINLVSGPAPRGMPQIPIEIEDDGRLLGVWPETHEEEIEGQTVLRAEEEIGGVTYSAEWFQYCGVQTSPALDPKEERNNEFRSAETTQHEWQQEDLEGGESLTLDIFEDYEECENEIGSGGLGKPALATWRSEDLSEGEGLTVQLIRSPLIEEAAGDDEGLAASTAEGILTYLNVCTHFCCLPGYKTNPTSVRVGGEDGAYCVCHQSVYDPFTITQQRFAASPRPDE